MSTFLLSIDKRKCYRVELDIVAYSDSKKQEYICFYGIKTYELAKELSKAKEIYWYWESNLAIGNAVKVFPCGSDINTDLEKKVYSVNIKFFKLCPGKIPGIRKKYKV